jgi:hypothetical protein
VRGVSEVKGAIVVREFPYSGELVRLEQSFRLEESVSHVSLC